MIKYWSILVYIYSPLYSTFVLQSKHDTHNNIYIYSIKRKKKLDDMIIRSCAIFQAILLRGRQILNWKLSWKYNYWRMKLWFQTDKSCFAPLRTALQNSGYIDYKIRLHIITDCGQIFKLLCANFRRYRQTKVSTVLPDAVYSEQNLKLLCAVFHLMKTRSK